jgi:hypothetical protein
MRLHHRHPEINARLRVLHLGCVTGHIIEFGILAEMGKFFPLLEMLRIENWRMTVEGEEKITPINTLRGLSLIGIEILDTKKSESTLARVLSGYLSTMSKLEILVLGARDTVGWKLFVRRAEMGPLFPGIQLPHLKFLWLRSWSIDCHDLLSLKAKYLKWLVLEECKGMNGGWIKALTGHWKGLTIIESDTKLKDGVNLLGWKKRPLDGTY